VFQGSLLGILPRGGVEGVVAIHIPTYGSTHTRRALCNVKKEQIIYKVIFLSFLYRSWEIFCPLLYKDEEPCVISKKTYSRDKRDLVTLQRAYLMRRETHTETHTSYLTWEGDIQRHIHTYRDTYTMPNIRRRHTETHTETHRETHTPYLTLPGDTYILNRSCSAMSMNFFSSCVCVCVCVCVRARARVPAMFVIAHIKWALAATGRLEGESERMAGRKKKRWGRVAGGGGVRV